MRRRGLIVSAVLLASVLGLTACGGGADQDDDVPAPLTYRPGLALNAEATAAGHDDGVRIEHVTYRTVDGTLVPSLFSIPTDRPSRGCLIYQPGFALGKDQTPGVRSGAASLGLSTFTIDPRNVGERGSVDQSIAALRQPATLRNMVADTAVDLRYGLDYLQNRPECHHKIAFLGTSFGAIVGAIVAGQDPRIKATVLTSVGPSFKRGVLMTNREAKADPDFPLAMVPGAADDAELLADAVDVLGPIDPDRWVGKIAPRPLLLINGREDPMVTHGDARAIAQAARAPKTVLEVEAGHDPFAPGPEQAQIFEKVARFLDRHLDLDRPS
jgi:fermentation-respiration switch protein FrsA (DUF1100 family)